MPSSCASRRPRLTAVLAAVTVTTGLLLPAPAVAHRRADTVAAAAMAVEPAAERARTLFDQGSAAYELSKYAEAVQKFEQSFLAARDIDDDALRERVLHALQFNLGRAHIKAYAIDRDVQRLRTALDLFTKYVSKGAELGIELEAETLMAEAQAELDRRAPPTPVTPPAPAPEPEPAPAAEPAPADDGDAGAEDTAEVAPMDPNTPDAGVSSSGKKLAGVGYASLGLAAAGFGTMAAGMVMGLSASSDDENAATASALRDAERRGALSNTLTVAGGVAGGVFALIGVSLIVVGKKKQKNGAGVSVLPGMHRNGASLSLHGRF